MYARFALSKLSFSRNRTSTPNFHFKIIPFYYHIWIRNETKKGEKRTAIIPDHAQKLVQAGHKVTVERSINRIFPDEDWEKIPGIEMVPSDSWRTSAPRDAYILGLKELPDGFPIEHRHIYFAHCYKGQKVSKALFSRYEAGKGRVLDLEFLVDDKGKRVCAFGWSAGYVGAAVSMKLWGIRMRNDAESLGKLSFWPSDDHMLADLRSVIQPMVQKHGKPKVMIVGALGRVGSGATSLLNKLEIEYTHWDRKQTGSGGPFKEIVTDYQVFLNCIYLAAHTTPFIDLPTLQKYNDDRKLIVIGDISCDWSSGHNPIPLYNRTTTLDDPTIEVFPATPKSSTPSEIVPRVELIGIDYLPTLLPRESSKEFSTALLPALLELDEYEKSSAVWKRAHDIFDAKKKEVLYAEVKRE